MTKCDCPFLSHHRVPCSASGIFAIGNASRITLCRQCLGFLIGETRAAKEAAKRQTAGFRVGNERFANDSSSPSHDGNEGKAAAIAAKVQPLLKSPPVVAQGFRFG